MNINKKGFASIALLIIPLIIGVGIVGYLVITYKPTPTTTPIPEQTNQKTTTPIPEQTNQNTTTSPHASNNSASNWQTYRNTKFGIELKYPADIFVVQEGDQYSKDLYFMDKRYAGKNIDLTIVPNEFSVNLIEAESINSLVEGERMFFSSPKSQVTILRTEETKIDGVRAVKVTTGDKTTKAEKGFFIVVQLPRPVTIPLSPDVTLQPGEPNFRTYNLISFGGKSEIVGVVDKIIKSIRFLK